MHCNASPQPQPSLVRLSLDKTDEAVVAKQSSPSRGRGAQWALAPSQPPLRQQCVSGQWLSELHGDDDSGLSCNIKGEGVIS
jgi:hypothetical protein